MIELETLKDFMTRRYGWLSPDGDLVVCSMYHHYEALGSEYSERYKELVDHYTEEMHSILDDEQSSLEEDEYYHPSMHRFNPHSDAADDLEKELYGKGYLRLGFFFERKKSSSMEAYGLESGIERHREVLKFIFEMCDLEKVIWTNSATYGKRPKVLFRK